MEDRPENLQKDWELEEDYYKKADSGPELRLEDFMVEDEPVPSLPEGEKSGAD